MRQIRRLIELIKRIFRRKKEDEEPIILDFKSVIKVVIILFFLGLKMFRFPFFL